MYPDLILVTGVYFLSYPLFCLGVTLCVSLSLFLHFVFLSIFLHFLLSHCSTLSNCFHIFSLSSSIISVCCSCVHCVRLFKNCISHMCVYVCLMSIIRLLNMSFLACYNGTVATLAFACVCMMLCWSSLHIWCLG